jgi:hypothetical protein
LISTMALGLLLESGLRREPSPPAIMTAVRNIRECRLSREIPPDGKGAIKSVVS